MKLSTTIPKTNWRRILYEYGEERYAPQIAAAIERVRSDRPIETTLELVDIIKSAMPERALREKQHPAKRSFPGNPHCPSTTSWARSAA